MCSDKSKLLGVHKCVHLSSPWPVIHRAPTEGDREGVWMLWNQCCLSGKRWEIKGFVGDIGELWDVHPDPSQPADDPVTSTARGCSEELG